MAGQNVTVKINGVKKEYPQGTRFLELAKEYQGEYAYPIVLAKEDGRLRELMKKQGNREVFQGDLKEKL